MGCLRWWAKLFHAKEPEKEKLVLKISEIEREGRRVKPYNDIYSAQKKRKDGSWGRMQRILWQKNVGDHRTDNNNVLYYVLVLQIGAQSPLQNKEPKQSTTTATTTTITTNKQTNKKTTKKKKKKKKKKIVPSTREVELANASSLKKKKQKNK